MDEILAYSQFNWSETLPKEVKGKNPVSSISSVADQYAVAFLNSSGGKVYWGVTDRERKVVGVELSYNQRDEIRRVVSEKLSNIQPLVSPSHFKLQFHNIIKENKVANDLFLIELIVDNVQVDDLFFTSSNDCYIKTDGGKKKLAGPQIQSEILRRYGIKNNI